MILLDFYPELTFITVATVALLHFKPKLPDLPLYALTGFVLIGVLNMGGLLDGRRWALHLESLRLLASIGLGAFLVNHYVTTQTGLWLALLVGIGVLSLLWLFRYRNLPTS